jgi:hypothetical protein
MDVEVDIEDIDDYIDDNDDNIDDNDDNIATVEEDIDDFLAEPPAPVLLTTTKSPTMAPSVMVSTQISVDAESPTASPSSSQSLSPTASPTASPSLSPTASPTASPSLSPTASPTASPSLSPTASPTASLSLSPTESAVEVDDNIDDNDDNIGDNDDDNLVDDSDDDSITTDLAEPPAPVLLPTITTQSPTTMAPSVMVSTQSSEDTPHTLPPGDDDALSPSPTSLAAASLPPCPADYDITKTTYVGGDLVKLSGNVFECQVELVKYCNIGLWDETLLAEDANAEEAWNNAWVFFSECAV